MVAKDGFYFDSNNLPVHLDGGGDTLQRLGMIVLACKLRQKLGLDYPDCFKPVDDWFLSCLRLLEVQPGVYIRNPTPPYNVPFNNPFSPSRDQLRSLVIALGACNRQDYLERLYKVQCTRSLFRYQNGDLATPENWNEFYRAGIMKPISVFGDLLLELDVLFRCHIKDPDNVGDDLDLIMTLLQAQYYEPTWESDIARYHYYDYRPINNGNIALKETNTIMGALAWYFRDPSAPKGMVELYRPLVAKMG